MSDFVEHLFKAHHAWLYTWLYKKIHDRQYAEDIVQDTFEKLITSQNLSQIQYPKSFLAKIASRIVIDQSRRKRIEQAYLEYLTLQKIDYDLETPENILIAVELLDHITMVLEGLDDQVQHIFLLRYIDLKSQTEIADYLQISRRTVQIALIKALQHCDTIIN